MPTCWTATQWGDPHADESTQPFWTTTLATQAALRPPLLFDALGEKAGRLPGEDLRALARLRGYTAHRAVNAVPYGCAAPPGIRTTVDLPQIIADLGEQAVGA